MFCKHNWKILSETTTESKVEHYIALGKDVGGNIPYSCMERKFIQIIHCEKCGKIKRYVEYV